MTARIILPTMLAGEGSSRLNVSVNVRIAGIAASAAFVLSALVGIIFGVGFPTVLIRAVIGGIVFGAGSFAALSLLKRYVPDLLTLSDDEGVAGNVDISVGDDEASTQDYESARDSTSSKRSHRGYFDESLVEEVEEVPAAPASSSETTDSPVSDEHTPGAESSAEGDEEQAAESGDALPDLQSFSGAFDSLDEMPSGDSQASGTGSDSNESGEGLNSLGSGGAAAETGGNDDPKMMADAIRTVLKRES